MSSCPTLVIAGTHSGAGKTSFALALTRALARRGRKVQTFKVGPDFLDPTYLALASGRPCYNLDGWMAGRAYCRRLFAEAAADVDHALVEGAMGLFDGAETGGDAGSTAEIARLLDAPIVLIANVHGMGRSFAALVKGYTTFEAGLRFAGVVANRCGSERHAGWLSDALRAAGLPPLLGAIPRGAFPELASRHLGLVTADRRRLPDSLLDDLADALERCLPMETLFPEPDPGERSEKKRAIPTIGKPGSTQSPIRLRVGVARDAAFHFYYSDLLDALAAAGCEILFFSPSSTVSFRKESPASIWGEVIRNSTRRSWPQTGRCLEQSALLRHPGVPSTPSAAGSCISRGGSRRTAVFTRWSGFCPPGRGCLPRERRSAMWRSP